MSMTTQPESCWVKGCNAPHVPGNVYCEHHKPFCEFCGFPVNLDGGPVCCVDQAVKLNPPDQEAGIRRRWAERAPHPVSTQKPAEGPQSDGPCRDCGQPCRLWFAPNEIWNRVVPDRVGKLCPNCFMLRASIAGVDVVWEIRPEPAAPTPAVASPSVHEVAAIAYQVAGITEAPTRVMDYFSAVAQGKETPPSPLPLDDAEFGKWESTPPIEAREWLRNWYRHKYPHWSTENLEARLYESEKEIERLDAYYAACRSKEKA